MSDLPKSVKIKEVGPREGFQFEKGAISLEDKISLMQQICEHCFAQPTRRPRQSRGLSARMAPSAARWPGRSAPSR